MFEFPISGVETYWWFPGVVAMLIATVTSTGGVTGAFIIMPFQVSILGYSSPGASSTNLLYNIIAIPSGVYRFHKEKRMLWSLAILTGLGTIPGLVLGAYIRIKYIPDPHSFKLFAGFLLLALAVKLVYDLFTKNNKKQINTPRQFEVKTLPWNKWRIDYEFDNHVYSIPTVPIFLVSLLVGVAGGAYGIGGGAILSPYLIAVYGLPVHSIAGAMLLGTWITSVVGVFVYFIIGSLLSSTGTAVSPDWLLGLSLGLGGLIGIYIGSSLQRFISVSIIKTILVVALLIIAVRYISGYFI